MGRKLIFMITGLIFVFGLILASGMAMAAEEKKPEQFVGVLAYRTGPFAAGGSGWGRGLCRRGVRRRRRFSVLGGLCRLLDRRVARTVRLLRRRLRGEQKLPQQHDPERDPDREQQAFSLVFHDPYFPPASDAAFEPLAGLSTGS